MKIGELPETNVVETSAIRRRYLIAMDTIDG
jgi:hypothetical protein